MNDQTAEENKAVAEGFHLLPATGERREETVLTVIYITHANAKAKYLENGLRLLQKKKLPEVISSFYVALALCELACRLLTSSKGEQERGIPRKLAVK